MTTDITCLISENCSTRAKQISILSQLKPEPEPDPDPEGAVAIYMGMQCKLKNFKNFILLF
ncbi:hypothetical protein FOXB_07204 [Fusarium oxysporum f. sp. conglutinans Fo5176]|uniref:Uncharacterized protein n=1 Tax=Fusarium oxysporum (strain Fo5176) TaxID=660025 RepID=F9FLC5_FUSOF|nr:hypothetical protein FOXB_07204 [Fusarium oxysporum f. sp. conglutinans Fo5176]